MWFQLGVVLVFAALLIPAYLYDRRRRQTGGLQTPNAALADDGSSGRVIYGRGGHTGFGIWTAGDRPRGGSTYGRGPGGFGWTSGGSGGDGGGGDGGGGGGD